MISKLIDCAFKLKWRIARAPENCNNLIAAQLAQK